MLMPCSTTPPALTDHLSLTCERILQILIAHRRSSESYGETTHWTHDAFTALLKQIKQFVMANQPLIFTLPAFPCKSPNLAKVLGALPDMGERLSLRFLQQLCDNIEKIYAPGAHIQVCSDGHVFGDLIMVSDRVVDDYASALLHMIDEEKISCVSIFNLGHVYGNLNYPQKRHQLLADWGQSISSIRQELLGSETNLQLYRGITRFLVEDRAGDPANNGGLSKTAIQRQCRQRSCSVIQRSWAWGELIAHYYPASIRLSIHPQPVHSTKLGIMLSGTQDKWLTPWHAVIIQDKSGSHNLIKHHEAKRIGQLVYMRGRPSHYVAT